MAKIYAVTVGSFDDYHIVALFKSRKKAIECHVQVAELNKDRFDPVYLEEYEEGILNKYEVLKVFIVEFDSDGNVMKVRKSYPQAESGQVDKEDAMWFCVYATDEAAAIKLAMRNRKFVLSELKGIPKEWRVRLFHF